ncbi:MAG TPA: hypothetical protein VHT52_05220 [Stellaceae bacterium]|jgi:hypothetical protein|nr:hypothetical protein [Stellaceae bacterium]
MSGGGKSFGSAGSPGFLSGFDKQVAQQALQGGSEAITNRYAQLGLGGTSATPSGPTTGATPGIPGSGTTPTNPGNFGAGSTAMQMDLGSAPSLTGGLPEEIQAMLGQVQTQDMSETGQQQSGKGAGGKGGVTSALSLAGGK